MLEPGVYRSVDLEILAALNRIALALEKIVDQRPVKQAIDMYRKHLDLMRQSQRQYRGMGYQEEHDPLKFIANQISKTEAAIEIEEQALRDIANRTAEAAAPETVDASWESLNNE